MVLARPLVLTLYGQKWVASADVLAVLSLYGAVFIICLLFANMITALGRTKLLLVLQLIWIGALVPAMAAGVHVDGIVGAAYAHVAVIAPIVLPSYLLILRRLTGVRLTALGRALLPSLLASALAALAARGAASGLNSPLIQLIGGLAAGGVVYAICAGPQLAALLGRGRAAQRVQDFYSAAGRLAGLRTDRHSKHSARYAQARASEAVKDTGPQESMRAYQGQLAANLLGDLTSRANLTYAYPQGGWPVQAVAVYERTLADQERRLGPDHLHTLASRANVAYAYRQAGWLAKALPLYERILADWTRLLGPDHPRTLRASNYLASTYREAGRLTEATRLYEQTLVARRRLLGPDHPSSLRSSHYLAQAYREAGRLAEAIPLYKQVLAARRQLLGPDHPSSLHSSHYLARAYREAGRLTEAIPLYEQALEGWQRLLGPDHPSSLRSSHYLARAYREAGRTAEAALQCQQTLAGCIRVLGHGHTLTRQARDNLTLTQELASHPTHVSPSGPKENAAHPPSRR
jgi:tetratricopeptide (TPR) repeat protein